MNGSRTLSLKDLNWSLLVDHKRICKRPNGTNQFTGHDKSIHRTLPCTLQPPVSAACAYDVVPEGLAILAALLLAKARLVVAGSGYAGACR